FFFSSRRRHTRFSRDWSSDVCSSDLSMIHNVPLLGSGAYLSLQKEDVRWSGADVADVAQAGWWMSIQNPIQLGKLETANQVDIRSEERRVGKECRCVLARERIDKSKK